MMTGTRQPFTIEIHFPDGVSDGYRTIKKGGWSGVGVICPQLLFPEKKKGEEFKRPGVYVLIGTSDETGNAKAYIGEGDTVLARLNDHYAKKDFWTKVVFFTSVDGSLNKAHIQYLESRLIALAREAKQCDLDNENNPTPPSLSKEVMATAENFLQEILRCFTALGIRLFHKLEKPGGRETKSAERVYLLRIDAKDIKATGYRGEDGFIVCAGSQAVVKVAESLQRRTQFKKTMRDRESLIDQGILKEDTERDIYVFTQDCLLSSPTNAANVVLGNPGDLGRWKDEHGTSLKEILDRESKSATAH